MYTAENVIPQPGKTYAINKKGSDTVVTLDGTNVVMRYWENLPSQKWECVETDGWLGFFSRASTVSDRGAYLGHNGGDGLECRQSRHQVWESFQVVLHDEGFALEVRKDNRLAFVGITSGGNGLKMLPKGTTWWGFTVIDSTPCQLGYAPSTRSLSVDVPAAPHMKLVLHW